MSVDPATASSAPVPIVLVGTGRRATAWAELLGRSRAARLVAVVSREPNTSVAGAPVPTLTRLEAALDAFPAARVAAALPPRAGLELALRMAAAERATVVEAPLHSALARASLPSGARAVQVAHGWTTAWGTRWGRAALAERPCRRVVIDAHGLPEAPGGDAPEVLVHGLALALALLPSLRLVAAARVRDSLIEVELEAEWGAPVLLRAHAEGQRTEVHVGLDEGELGFHLGARTDTVWSDSGKGRRSRERDAVPASARALHQLVDPEAAHGDDLLAAQRVAVLAAEVERAMGRRRLVEARGLAAGAARSGRLEGLGLVGALPEAPPPPAFALPGVPEPTEFWGFRAGRKPVVFLTVRPEEADRVAAHFDGAHVERRSRRVHIGPQDTWTDRRDAGDERVELYISRDADLAVQAARLQVEGDPSASLRELGRLMGYPECCVDAFALQSDRSNNTWNRYLTASRTLVAVEPWPWQLNNLFAMLVPFFPCTYGCAAAREEVDAAVEEMERAYPGVRDALSTLLARPVLYFDDGRLIVLHGSVRGGEVRYSGASVPEGAPEEIVTLGGVIAQGDHLSWNDDALVVRAGGREVARLKRSDPGLGLLAPFSEERGRSRRGRGA